MILIALLVMGMLIMLAGAARPTPSRTGIVGRRPQQGRSVSAGDDLIGSVPLQDSWTELDEYQLRRLLEG